MAQQIELFPLIKSVNLPDLWGKKETVKNLGNILALELSKGDYEVIEVRTSGQNPNHLFVAIRYGKDVRKEIVLSSKKNEKGPYPIGFFELEDGCAKVKKWTIPKDFEVNCSSERVESWKNTVSLRKEDKAKKQAGLRSPQFGAAHAICAHWSLSSDPGTIVMPTGTGKTETMMVITALEQCSRVLLIVPSDALRTQIAEKFARFGILKKIGIVDNLANYPIVALLRHAPKSIDALNSLLETNVIVTTPNTFKLIPKALKKQLIKECSHLFVDESHHIAAATWNAIKESFREKRIIQFTATPFRNDKNPVLGKPVYNYPLIQAQKDGSFGKISLVSVSEPNPDKYDFAIAQAAYKRLLSDRQQGFVRHRVMVRTNSIEKAKKIEQLYKKEFPNESTVSIHGETTGRKKKIEHILNGDFTFIICVDMLKEGFDFPELKIAAIHDLHKSLAVLLQFIGRFTRTETGLGSASFIVNLEREEFSSALETLFGDGTGWDKAIAEISATKQEEANRLLNFLEGCEPMSGFDDPNIELNSKIIRPSMSTVMYECGGVDWNLFIDAFDKSYHITTPFINENESIMFFTVQRRQQVKWSKSKVLKDQIWDAFVLYHNKKEEILYISCSDNKFAHVKLASAINKGKAIIPIHGEKVFRSFGGIKRLRVLHAGLLKPANRKHRYSKFSGADVSEQLDKLSSSKSKKSDFVGVGFNDGKPVGIACSAKGKIWSPSKRGNVYDWKNWCIDVGKKVLDPSISTDQIFKDRVKTVELTLFPADKTPIGIDWPQDFYDNIGRIKMKTQKGANSISVLTTSLQILSGDKTFFDFKVYTELDSVDFRMTLNGDFGQKCTVLAENQNWTIEMGRSKSKGLDEYLSENPPVIYYSDGSSQEGCLLHSLPDNFELKFPEKQVKSWSWEKSGVNIRHESRFDNSGLLRTDSIQDCVLQDCVKRGAKLVFDDDGSGEMADVIAIYENEKDVLVELTHCKFSSKATAGARIGDLTEVCGQAIKSVKWTWNPKQILENMKRRVTVTKLGNDRFYFGDKNTILELKKTLKYKKWEFKISIVQPGVDSKTISKDMINLLSMTNSNLMDTCDSKLQCIFS